VGAAELANAHAKMKAVAQGLPTPDWIDNEVRAVLWVLVASLCLACGRCAPPLLCRSPNLVS
jgi:hypothetical protein